MCYNLTSNGFQWQEITHRLLVSKNTGCPGVAQKQLSFPEADIAPKTHMIGKVGLCGCYFTHTLSNCWSDTDDSAIQTPCCPKATPCCCPKATTTLKASTGNSQHHIDFVFSPAKTTDDFLCTPFMYQFLVETTTHWCMYAHRALDLQRKIKIVSKDRCPKATSLAKMLKQRYGQFFSNPFLSNVGFLDVQTLSCASENALKDALPLGN